MNMLDVAAVAAYVVWMAQMQEWNRSNSNKRHRFLTELSNKLVLPVQMRRFKTLELCRRVRRKLSSSLGLKVLLLFQLPQLVLREDAMFALET